MILTQSNIPVTFICQVRWSNIFHQHTCRVHHAGEPMFIWGSTSAPKHGTIPWHVIQFKHSAVWNLLYSSCSLMTNNGCTYIIYSISLTKFTPLTVRLWVKIHTNPYASINNLPNVPAAKKAPASAGWDHVSLHPNTWRCGFDGKRWGISSEL
jgi:hypothetical protein